MIFKVFFNCIFSSLFLLLGTAAVVVAGLLASSRVLQRKMSEMRYLFFGAGGAGVGIAEMCVKQMESEGMETSEAQKRIYLMDSGGIVNTKR